MKNFIKIFFVFVLGIMMMSCRKPVEKTQTVTFYANGIETGSMTRSADHDAIRSLIQSTYPDIKPEIWYGEYGSGARHEIITLGQSMTVDVGHWLCYYSAPNDYSTTGNPFNTGSFRNTPHMFINQYVDIVPGTTQYVLDVTMWCSSFVWDISEVSTVYYNDKNATSPSTKLTSQVASGSYACVFMTGKPDNQGDILMVQVRPANNLAEAATYYFSNSMDSYNGIPCHKIEYGHYYVLHPTFITDISGSFSVNIPAWTCSLD